MKHLAAVSKDRPRESSAEFRVGVHSGPYLGDHGFQDMVVLPGTSYVAMALSLDWELSERVPEAIRNIIFHNPVILAAEDTVIRVEVNDHGDGRVEYTFYEAGADHDVARASALRPAARLEIDRSQSNSVTPGIDALAIEAFKAKCDVTIDSKRFYKTLRENGNQYGPHFQNVSSIWRNDQQLLGRLRVVRPYQQHGPHYLDSVLLDSITQLLAPFILEKGKTLVLRSIEKIDLKDVSFPNTLWGHATRLPAREGDGKALLGNVRVYDPSGKLHLDFSGIAFTLLDQDNAVDKKAAANLVIASNFTAEPLEDTLGFWGDHLGVRINTEFAPYNQIFQQLLDTGSAFRRNSDGVNVILLGLEEWAEENRHTLMNLSRERREQCFGARARCVLPNGLEIVHLNQYETDYVYEEIFEDQCYLRHGIRLQDDATVLDIGANIGLFSLFVMSRCQNPNIYACEPAPVVYDLLKANCDAYGSNVRPLNIGVSDKKKTAAFTFYEKSSVFSGFHSDISEDREAIQAVVRNILNRVSVAGESVEEYVKELTAGRLGRRSYECQLKSVSDIIRENRIDRIDLLKIDAEKSELDIIKGIEDRDWPKIDQIVMEIHDPTRKTTRQIENLLIEKGYQCAVEQETLLANAGLFNLYAKRPEAAVETRFGFSNVPAHAGSGRTRDVAGSLRRNVRDFCAALRSFMAESKVPLVLGFCPKSPVATADAEQDALLSDAEKTLLLEAGKIANVHTISSELLLQRYPVRDYYDTETRHAAHIPYTPACYAAIGTTLVRTIHNLRRSPFKVIVLDCDNTLWKGVCGEDGALGVEVTAPYRALQEFMIAQMKSGMLLCLCSKNNERDVLDVFDQQTDMRLKREHLVAWRINWSSKSKNIEALARELNLGLESFIFIDDNPVDCADVRINCPGVLSLQLPGNAESFPSFLNHVWAFDHLGSTKEDQHRTQMYMESGMRERYREKSLSLRDFIHGLQLRIEIAEPTEAQLDRVSQLTFRTNQFNFTTKRRSVGEIRNFLKRETARCLSVCVADRFGDYGLVGVLMYEAEADRCSVDTLLLSCRVLGRGVEHAMVSRLGQLAVRAGRQFVEFTYLPTNKNSPALDFIAGIGDRYHNDTGTSWTFPAEFLAGVEYDPDEKAPVEGVELEIAGSDQPTTHPALTFDSADRTAHLQYIGEHLCDVDRLSKAIDAYRSRGQLSDAPADVLQGNAVESTLLNIWRKVLGRPGIGLSDNFFEVGGTSLRAVQVIAAIKQQLKQTLSIVSLFECPTVALLAAKLSPASAEDQTRAAIASAAQRGQKRRYNTMRQKAS